MNLWGCQTDYLVGTSRSPKSLGPQLSSSKQMACSGLSTRRSRGRTSRSLALGKETGPKSRGNAPSWTRRPTLVQPPEHAQPVVQMMKRSVTGPRTGHEARPTTRTGQYERLPFCSVT
jgi:hypothetical protein